MTAGRRLVCTIALILFAHSPAYPEDSQTSKSPSAPVSAEGGPGSAENLSPDRSPEGLWAADKLSIKFSGYRELSGEYRVNSDDTVSIPVLGRVALGKLDTAGLEKQLAAKLVQLSGREGYVTVEIASYRPLYVTGAVRSPGSIPWRPGLTVLQAVALAGGVGAAVRPNDVPDATKEAATKNAFDDQKRTLAALARVRAEQQGSDDIKVPAELIAIAGEQQASELIKREKSILTTQLTSYNNQLATLEQGVKLASIELDGLRSQAKRIAEQLRLRQEYMKKIQELVTKGVVIAQRGMEEEIKVSDLEEKNTNISVALARVQGTMTGLQRDIAILKGNRQTSLQNELTRLERDASRLKNEIGVRSGSLGLSESRLTFRVVRRGAEGAITLSATESTQVWPADVLVVVGD